MFIPRSRYFNQISGPGALSNILLLLQHGGLLTDTVLQEADVNIRRGADWWVGWSGYNLVSLAMLNIYRGLLKHDEALVDEGFASPQTVLPLPMHLWTHSDRLRVVAEGCVGPARADALAAADALAYRRNSLQLLRRRHNGVHPFLMPGGRRLVFR